MGGVKKCQTTLLRHKNAPKPDGGGTRVRWPLTAQWHSEGVDGG